MTNKPNSGVYVSLDLLERIAGNIHQESLSAIGELAALLAQPADQQGEPDFKSDDSAIHTFTKLMAHKMARSAEKGRSGWQQCSQDDLSRMLREHVEKGDPVDVANFCMMLSASGFSISKLPTQPATAKVDEEAEFEKFRKEQIASLIRMGYPDAAKAFQDLGSVQWAGWQARAKLNGGDDATA